MITTKGKVFLKRFLTGQAGTLVGAISVGIGDAAPTLGDTKLGFEISRVPIDVAAYDFSTDQIIWKGSLDSDLQAKIYEVGIWTNEVNTVAGNQESKLITTFDSSTEAWDVFTSDATVTRIGADSLKQAPVASATVASLLSGLTLDLSQNSSLDTITLAYNVDNAFTSAIKVRLRTDASNYYEFTISTPTTGYKFSTFTLGAAAVTGVPDWSNINEVEIRTTATAGGTAGVEFDGLRIDDTDTVAPEYGLIARFKYSVAVSKVPGVVQDAEYGLAVSI